MVENVHLCKVNDPFLTLIMTEIGDLEVKPSKNSS